MPPRTLLCSFCQHPVHLNIFSLALRDSDSGRFLPCSRIIRPLPLPLTRSAEKSETALLLPDVCLGPRLWCLTRACIIRLWSPGSTRSSKLSCVLVFISSTLSILSGYQSRSRSEYPYTRGGRRITWSTSRSSFPGVWCLSRCVFSRKSAHFSRSWEESSQMSDCLYPLVADGLISLISLGSALLA